MTDEEVLESLENEGLSNTIRAQIKERKLQAAIPVLLEIVRGQKRLPAKLSAAATLVSLGNTSWLPDIKPYVADPNSGTTLRERISVAGALALGGDYSHFDMVEESLGTGELKVRQAAIKALGAFGQVNGQVATRAVELLEATAVGDSDASLRNSAIASLEKIVEAKPERKTSLVRAYEANINSDNRYLKAWCEAGLKKYRDKSEQ